MEEECAVGQFADNCIYLIADPESDMARRAVRAMEMYTQQMDSDDYYNDYTLEVVADVELKNHPRIKERVEQHADNFLIQLAKRSSGKRRFIVARTDLSRLFPDIGLMIYAAERVAKLEITALLQSLVEEEDCCLTDLVELVIEDPRFKSRYFEEQSKLLAYPSFGMCVKGAVAARYRGPEEEKRITHKKRLEMYDRLPENLRKYHKTHDPRIKEELYFIFSIIDPSTLRRFFLKQSPRLQEKINNFINPKRQAEASMMNVEIRKFDHIDKVKKTRGFYRVFMNKDEDRLMVDFSRRAGFVLYLMYLVDRKKNGDNVDTLDLGKYKQLFGELFRMTYGYSGESVFNDMIENSNDKAQQKGLYYVMQSIRHDVGQTCERMEEPAEPFLLRDTSAHLAVLPRHIIIPDEIMEINKC